MKDKRPEILRFISLIRHSHKHIEGIYTKGACYQFYKILKHIYPEAVPHYQGDHVYTKIGEHFYDITGEIEPTEELTERLPVMSEVLQIRANDWVIDAYDKNPLRNK